MLGIAHGFILAVGGIALLQLHGDARLRQPNCSCPPRQFVPLTGRVVDSADGHPITGATVTFHDWGDNTMDSKRHLYDLGPLRGEIGTGPDGSYTFPVPEFGRFSVRAWAPGYLGAVQVLPARIAGDNPDPRLRGDSTLRLTRNTLHLLSMSVQALEAFGPPRLNVWWGMRQYITAGFSPDGKRIGFVTLDKDRLPGGATAPVLHCRAWTYEFDRGALTVAELSESPLGEKTSCTSDKNLTWSGDKYYILTVRGTGKPVTATVEAVRGTEARELADTNSLPASVQSALARIGDTGTDDTNDGRFTLEETPEYGCTDLTITRDKPGFAASTDCAASYLLDRDRDLLYMIDGGKSGETESWFGALVELNLLTGRQRFMRLPAFELKPGLLALRDLPGGAIELAYTMEGASNFPGECDQAASEYYPWPMLLQVGDFRRHTDGSMPHLFSVCFITVPPAQAQPLAASEGTNAHP